MAVKRKRDRGIMGFYIALCCCVLVVGAIGYFKSASLRAVTERAEDASQTPLPTAMAMPAAEPLPEPEELPVFGGGIEAEDGSIEDFIPTAAPVTEDNPDIAEVNAPARASRGLAMPVNGEILAVYSSEPTYNRVLGDWRTHSGTDIAASEGSEVRCAADGEIKSVRETVYGTEVTVSHSDGYETVYTQISVSGDTAPGKNLRQGDVIGTVAAPKGEEVTEPHLHFGVKKDGKYCDPAEALAEGNA